MIKKNKIPLVSISLITYNAERYLPFCLQSLLQQSFTDWQLLIIDNGSTDRTIPYLRENYPQFKVVTHQDNVGFAKAHNQAIDWTKSKYVFCLNQDIILDKDYLRRAVKFLEENKQVGAVTGKLYKWNFTTNEKTNILDSTGLCLTKNRRVMDRGENKKDRSQYNAIEQVFGVSGAVPLYRRQALVDIKIKTKLEHEEYFDEDFFSYKEDVDLAYRLRLNGWQAFYLPIAVAWHDRSLSNSQLQKSWQIAKAHRKKNKLVNYLSYRNHLFTLYKNEFRINILKNILPILWYEGRKWLFMQFFNNIKSRQFRSFWQLYPLMKKKRQQIKKLIKIKPQDLSKWYSK